jgi:hypothetical protein
LLWIEICKVSFQFAGFATIIAGRRRRSCLTLLVGETDESTLTGGGTPVRVRIEAIDQSDTMVIFNHGFQERRKDAIAFGISHIDPSYSPRRISTPRK